MSLYPGAPGAISSRLGAARGRLLARPTGQPATSRGPSLTTSQVANRQVSSLLAPQIRAQTAYAAHQNDVIRSFANSLLGKLQPIAGQIGQAYDTGVRQIGSLSGQAASFLQGQNPSAQVSPLLQAVNAPAEQQAQIQGKLGQTFGGGAGVLAFTGGVIPGQALAEQGAAAKASALQLPAIAALKGQQDLASAAFTQGQAMAKIQAQRPELYQTAVKNIQANQAARAKLAQQERAATEKVREFNVTRSDKQAAVKATAAYRQGQLNLGYYKADLSAADKAAQRKETAAYHDAYLGHLAAGDTERVAHDAALEAATNTRNQISQQQANTSAYNAVTGRISARTSRTRAQTAATTATTTAAETRRHHLATERTAAGRAATYAKGQAAKVAAAKKTGGVKPPTANEITNFVQKWYEGKPTSVIDPNTGKSTTVATGKLDYPAAYRQLRAWGISDKKARQYLNVRYTQLGQRGRSWLTNEAQAVMAQANAGAAPGTSRVYRLRFINGHPVLNSQTVALLRQHNLLPPGQMTREGFYVISGG